MSLVEVACVAWLMDVLIDQPSVHNVEYSAARCCDATRACNG